MSSKRWIALTVLLAQLFACAGCWDAKDIGELDLPIAAGYDIPDPVKDKQDQDLRIVVSTISPNLGPKAKGEVRVERIAAQTIGETREKRNRFNPDFFLVSSLQVAVFGEELAKKGIMDLIDLLYRDPRIKHTLYLAVVEGRADELFQVKMKNYKDMGFYLLDLLRRAGNKSFIPSTTLFMFGIDWSRPGENQVLPLIKVQGKDRVSITGVGIFKKDKLIAKVRFRDARALVLLRGLKTMGQIPFVVKKNGQLLDQGTVELSNSRKVKVDKKGDQYHYQVTVNLKGVLRDHIPKSSLIKHEELFKEIEKAVESELTRDCYSLISKMQQEFGVDCIDVTNYALSKWRYEVQDIIDSEEFVKNIKIDVKVNVNLENIGDRT